MTVSTAATPLYDRNGRPIYSPTMDQWKTLYFFAGRLVAEDLDVAQPFHEYARSGDFVQARSVIQRGFQSFDGTDLLSQVPELLLAEEKTSPPIVELPCPSRERVREVLADMSAHDGFEHTARTVRAQSLTTAHIGKCFVDLGQLGAVEIRSDGYLLTTGNGQCLLGPEDEVAYLTDERSAR